MADDRIDSYVDRTGFSSDTGFVLKELNEVYSMFKKLDGFKLGIARSEGMSTVIQQTQQYSAVIDTVTQRIAKLNGSSKEFTTVLLGESRATKELSAAKLNEAKARTENARAAAIEEKGIRDSSKAKVDDQKLTDQAINDYLQLSKAYTDAAQKARNYQLVLGFNHPVALQAIKDANDMANLLKRLDASVGQHTRSVGHYSKAFDGLGFSFAQVGRELPSLGINLQTFALAISNNLPIVADELRKAKDEIKAMKAEGKDTPSLFQRMKSALFSFQTGLSLVITGLVLFTKSLGHAKKASEEYQKQTEKLTEALREQRSELDKVTDAIDRQTGIDLDKLRAKGATKEELFQRELQGEKEKLDKIKTVNAEEKALLNKEIKDAFEFRAFLAENGIRNLTKAEVQAYVDRYKAINKEIKAGELAVIIQEDKIEALKAKRDAERFEEAKDEAERRRKAGLDAAKDAKEAADAELQFQFDIKALEIQRTIDFNKELADNEELSLTKRLEALQKYYKASQDLTILNAELQKKLGYKTATELELVTAQTYDNLLRLEKEFQDGKITIIKQFTEKFDEEEKKLTTVLEKELEERFKRFKAGHDARLKDTELTAKKELEIRKETQQKQLELFNEIQEAIKSIGDAYFTKRINQLQQEIDLIEERKARDIAAATAAAGTAEERAAKIRIIEANAQVAREQLQRRQRDFEVKKAQFDKAASIARIVQETAIQIVNNLDKPFLLGLIAAIGAAQLAAVIAQPIPRYKHGTEHHHGGPAMVGDGGKSELITLPDGRQMVTPSTPVIVDLPRGSKVKADAEVAMNMSSRDVSRLSTGSPDGVIPAMVITSAVSKMEKSVVNAIKSIPQPITKVEGIISRRIRRGDSSNTYLNNNLQG